MVWSYSGDPAANPKDAVRFYLGDTDPDDPQLQDEEILFLVQKFAGNVYLAAADAARGLAGKYSRRADKAVGDLRLSFSQQAQHYWELAKRLQTEAGKRAVPYAGGISKSDKKTQEEDTDRVRPAFKRGMMRNKRAPSVQEDTWRRGCWY
ncbi:MAG: hypothetical protein LHW58_08380 [Candidatus Cloacimonetes bacterium]|jgi:hypothetical protein|nr:hypothetical protein [Candidatus Cloacimonadota bacterium]HHY37203.1 hypothetical protein [Bacillota bacterium]